MESVRTALFPSAPRYLGLALIGAGVASLSIFLAMYHSSLADLWGEDYREIAGMQPRPKTTPASWVAVIVILVGIFTFAAVIFRAI
jgi:putative membrane protein